VISPITRIASLAMVCWLAACTPQPSQPIDTTPLPDINALINNSLVYAQRGSIGQAQQSINQALALDPNSIDANNIAGLIYGKSQQAEEKFLRAGTHAGNPNPEIAYTNAGLCALRVPDIDQAENYFKTALDFKQKNSVTLFQLAQINLTKGRGIPALERLHAYSQFASHSPQTLKLGIEIGRLMRDKEVEVSYFNLLQNEYPTSKEYQWAIATIN
tara:strand:- start:117 stop:764 length:648 start_codon:yes stop_codon:yes gene_type:complete